MKKEYCGNCNEYREYEIKEVNKEVSINNQLIKFKGKEAYCVHCNEEIDVDEVMDYNNKKFQEAYKTLNDIITKEEIEMIMDKYNIGKRPLSLVLGLGEVTIARYFEGYIPSKENSRILKEVLNNPMKYYLYLQSNKNKISNVAYKKTLSKIEMILNIKDQNTKLEDYEIENVSKYIESIIDVSPKLLQKLLYYVQMFMSVFNGMTPFSSKCSAWNHGPVFGKVYYQYKEYGYHLIEEQEEYDDLDPKLKEVVDAVIKYFGIYSANTLEYFTHQEEPYLKALNSESKVIEKSAIKEYGEKIIKEYNINSPKEIYKYSEAMFNKFKEENK